MCSRQPGFARKLHCEVSVPPADKFHADVLCLFLGDFGKLLNQLGEQKPGVLYFIAAPPPHDSHGLRRACLPRRSRLSDRNVRHNRTKTQCARRDSHFLRTVAQ